VLHRLWPDIVAEFTGDPEIFAHCWKISYPVDNVGYSGVQMVHDQVQILKDKGHAGWDVESVTEQKSVVRGSDGGVVQTSFGWTTLNCEFGILAQVI